MIENQERNTALAAPILSEWDVLRHQAKVLVESQFLPKAIDTWQKATAVMMYGKELGIGPMEACQSIDVIQGKPTQKPQSMKAMVHRKLPSAIFRPIKMTAEECIYEAARPGDPVVKISFHIKDAERLGLTTKDNWKKQPEVMLNWRCVGKVARMVFPDCLSGVSYSPEELGAEVDDEHNVIVVAPTKNERQQLKEKRDETLSKPEIPINPSADKAAAIARFERVYETALEYQVKTDDLFKTPNEVLLSPSDKIIATCNVLESRIPKNG